MPSWTDEEALRWVEAAGGKLHRRRCVDESEEWVVLLRAPTARPGAGRLILGFGDSIAEAVDGARAGWDSVWGQLRTD